ncbi:MAG: hypothetical protein ACYCPS_02545 [Candidatus Saccharimonadales bacterium]
MSVHFTRKSMVKPHVDNPRWFAKVVGPYPVTREYAIATARDWHFSDNTVELLALLPPGELFTSQEQLLSRCLEAEESIML